jgi:hypothetical protein
MRVSLDDPMAEIGCPELQALGYVKYEDVPQEGRNPCLE